MRGGNTRRGRCGRDTRHPQKGLSSVSDQDDRDSEDFPSVDELIGSFMNETSLWPVLVVAIASMGAFGAAMLVLTGIDHNPFAAAAL